MSTDWRPANDVESALLRAVADDDRQGFFQIIAEAPLYLPAFAETDADDGTPSGQRFVTWDLLGHTFLPVFTSVEALAATVGDVTDSYTVTSYDELRSKWPSPDWRLAVNPGHPIDAWLAVEAVSEAAAGTTPVSTLADLDPGSPDEDPAEDAALDGYLRNLLESEVLVPTAVPVADEDGVARRGFPWRVASGYERPTIEVYTSSDDLMAGCPPGTPWIRDTFAVVVAVWPDGHDLAVDPASPVGFSLPADEVQGLLLWAESTDEPDVGMP